MFGWLTERRRRKLEEAPFPPAWQEIIDENVRLFSRLDATQQERLRDLVVVFIDEKHWEGCGELELTDEHRVTIAALACVLLLGREHVLYEDVESILVYPSTVVTPVRKRSFFDPGLGVQESGTAILGEAHYGGPVILAWDQVRSAARGAKHNVVFHEFAHKIDMQDGTVDGTPPLDSSAARRAWADICSKSFLELRDRVEAGKKSFIDEYGATNEAEFFAVATETYFTRGKQLREEEPELYELLKGFYRFEL